MTEPTLRTSVHLGTRAAGASPSTPLPEGAPLRIAVLGDFSGRESRRVREPIASAHRRLYVVDRDDLDDVFALLKVELHLPAGSAPAMRVTFGELDDLHPDYLFKRLEVFERLSGLRRRLENDATFPEAAAELRAEEAVSNPDAPGAQDPHSTDAEGPSDGAKPGSGGGLLDTVLAATGDTALPGDLGGSGMEALIREIVRPYSSPVAGTEQRALLASVDRAIGAEMRRLLHRSAFRALEANWRGLDLLVRRIETGRRVRLHLFDVTRDELAADLEAAAGPAESGLLRCLQEHSGGEPWGLWMGGFGFGRRADDSDLLARVAAVCATAGTPFVANAEPELAGCTSLARTPDPEDWTVAADPAQEEAWEALRAANGARHLALALPRLLLRMPYGRRTSPTESFAFEELDPDAPRDHEALAWGGGALAVVLAVAEGVTRRGGQRPLDGTFEVSDLPLLADGDESIPSAEVDLPNDAAERMRARGLLPLRSVRGAPRVRLGPITSLTGEPLSGPWPG